MDYKDLFAALAIGLIGIVAFIGVANDFNTGYDQEIGSEVNNTAAKLQTGIGGNLSEIGRDAGDAGTPQEGQSLGTGEDSLAKRGIRIIGLMPDLLGIPQVVIQDVGNIFKVPPVIINVIIDMFVFAFILTLGYLLVIGARSLFF